VNRLKDYSPLLCRSPVNRLKDYTPLLCRSPVNRLKRLLTSPVPFTGV
jgi:hypothetical protein